MASNTTTPDDMPTALRPLDELECIGGKYFDMETGKYVTLPEREARMAPEKRLQGLPGVVDVSTVGYTYWHIDVTEEADRAAITEIMNDIYGRASLDHTYQFARGHHSPAEEGLVYKITG